jgi:hypothetical protein
MGPYEADAVPWPVRPSPYGRLQDGRELWHVSAPVGGDVEPWRSHNPRAADVGSEPFRPLHDEVSHGGIMRTKPVAVLTAVYSALIVLLGTAAVTDLLPTKVLAAVTIVVAILGALLGGNVYSRVTPLADPRDDRGRPLTATTRNV